MSFVFLGLGLVFVLEGLVIALAPSRLESIMEMLRNISIDQRRLIGLLSVGLGVTLVFIAKTLGI